MSTFSDIFATADAAIMGAVGDAIVFTPPTGAAISTNCVLSARPNTGEKDNFAWSDNVWSKIDLYSVVVDIQESAAPLLSKGWTALYQGKTYTVTDFYPKGDLVVMVILNVAGNSTAVTNGWK